MTNPVPQTSNQWQFLPSTGELGLNAFARIGIRRAELTEEHMQNLRVSANLLLADWSVDIPNLWTIDLQTQVLSTGVGTYDVDPTTVAMLDTYISIDNGDGTTTDLIIYPISRTEYASFPLKSQQGRPTVFWFDRLLSPTVTVWPEPDPSTTYTLKYYRAVQFQDANFVNGQNAQIPPRFFEAFAAGLAAKLAWIYPPANQLITPDKLQALADRAWQRASQQDIETGTPLYIFPGLLGYYR
ncbi:MAG: hypothetical protein KGL39_04540 [Patescibacteria group bacterium]|nr:hypothetical protein [Patescibacteria group bacterium]